MSVRLTIAGSYIGFAAGLTVATLFEGLPVAEVVAMSIVLSAVFTVWGVLR